MLVLPYCTHCKNVRTEIDCKQLLFNCYFIENFISQCDNGSARERKSKSSTKPKTFRDVEIDLTKMGPKEEDTIDRHSFMKLD